MKKEQLKQISRFQTATTYQSDLFLVHSSPLKKCIISAINIVVMQLTSNSGSRRI